MGKGGTLNSKRRREEIQRVLIYMYTGSGDAQHSFFCHVSIFLTQFFLHPTLSIATVTISYPGLESLPASFFLFLAVGPRDVLERKCLFCCLIHSFWEQTFRGLSWKPFFVCGSLDSTMSYTEEVEWVRTEGGDLGV